MGIILDIVDKVAPEAQELMEKQGLDLKEALIKREYTYELVKMFSEKLKNHNNVNINLLEIDVDYEIDDFYVNVDNWGILKWGD